MAQGQETTHGPLRVGAELPRLLAGEHLVRAVQAHNGGEYTKLHPAGGQFIFPVTVAVAANVMAPPAITYIGCGSGKIRLIVQRFPGNKGTAGESDGIAVAAQTGKAAEVHSTVAAASVVQIVIVIEHPQGIVAGHTCVGALLPIHPPEIHAHLLIGMMQILEIGVHKFPIGHIKGNGDFLLRVHAQFLSHSGVCFLVRPHAISRMHIQGHVHTPLVQFFHHACGIGEQFLVPCVSRPTLAVLRVDIHIVPAHILNGHRDGELFLRETVHQLHILFLSIAVIAAPPVSQRPAGQHRGLSGQAEKQIQRPAVITPTAHKVHIGVIHRGRFYPAVRHKQQGLGIINHSKTVFGQQTVTKLNRLVRLTPDLGLVGRITVVVITYRVVQRGGSAFQIAHAGKFHISIKPNSGFAQVGIGTHLHGQSVLGKRLFIIGDDQILGDNLQLVRLILDGELRHRKLTVEHNLGLLIHKFPVGAVLHADQLLGQYSKAICASGDNTARISHAACGSVLFAH